jgi:hypothetical protein
MKNLLKEMADEKIKFEFSLSKENPLIKGDPQQIREILIELVLMRKMPCLRWSYIIFN